MGFFGFCNVIRVRFKELTMLPTNLAKVASINKYLETQQELTKTQQRLKEVEQQLAKEAAIKAGRMFFCDNVYWSKDAANQIEKSPYCPRCFELDGKAVHLIIRYNKVTWIGKCPECKVDEISFRMPK
jgi:formylmethanofuran dehydrogenase subunit E